MMQFEIANRSQHAPYPYDMAVPPLGTYFTHPSTIRAPAGTTASNPYFGQGANAPLSSSGGTAPPGAIVIPAPPQYQSTGAIASSPDTPSSPLSALSLSGSFHQPTPHSPSINFAAMDKLFYNGTPNSGNAKSLYIQVPSTENEGGVSCGSEFWVSVPWDKVVPRLLDHPEVLNEVMQQVVTNPELKEKALSLMGFDSRLSKSVTGEYTTSTPSRRASNQAAFYSAINSSGGQYSGFQYPSTAPASVNEDRESITSQPYPSSSNYLPHTQGGTSSNHWSAPASPHKASNGLNLRMPPQDGPATPLSGLKPWDLSSNQLGDLSLRLPPMPASRTNSMSGVSSASYNQTVYDAGAGPSTSAGQGAGEQHGIKANIEGVSIMVAREDTIDPFLLADPSVMPNDTTLEYVWSHSDTTLYKADTAQGQQALTEAGTIQLVFPPRTMLMAQEKDGTLATPAYSNLHPHSNEWLKAQVCHRSCPYRAGTASLKRPKTVREHFRKCVYLDENHPLKVLSSLQLAVLERESQGVLPNRRRARVIRLATEAANKQY